MGMFQQYVNLKAKLPKILGNIGFVFLILLSRVVGAPEEVATVLTLPSICQPKIALPL